MALPLAGLRFKAFKDDNSPAVAWKLYTYVAGTATPQATYSDAARESANTNPVEMDGSGEADVYLIPGASYKFVLTDENDVPQRTIDDVNSAEAGSFTTLSASGASTLHAVTLTTLSASGQITSTVATGTAPLVIASQTKVANLNVAKLDDATWEQPKALGGTTPNTGKFTTLETTDAITAKSQVIQETANGARIVRGSTSEEITLSTSGATTDSTADLLPANAVLEAVVARVTASITTATDWKLGDATTAARFCAAQSGAQLVAGATVVGMAHLQPDATAAAGPVQSAAAKLRITCTGTAGSGKIRVTVFWRSFVAPTS